MLTKRSVGTVILLTIVTCGIYGLYWAYKTIFELHAAGEKSNLEPMIQFILMFFYVGFIIFALNADANLNAIREKKGLSTKDNKILYLLLGIFVPIVLVALVQQEMNALSDAQ